MAKNKVNGQGQVKDREIDGRIDAIEKQLSAAEPFSDPKDALEWFSKVIILSFKKSSREKSLTRLRAISGAIDSWVKTYRLSSDTAELEELKKQLEALRERVDEEARNAGPRAVK
jgi:chromosome segregation ATPase